MIGFEAPRVEADGNVIGERVGAGEIEIDQPRQPIGQKEHIVRKQIGVDYALWQALRPLALEYVELGRDKRLEVTFHFVRVLAATLVELAPAGNRKRIVAAHIEIGSRDMELRQ